MAAIRQGKVELACEGFYYWDMRRWKLARKHLAATLRSWSED
ncbi:RagB/SusD family nutrient uptake outer membrane protein [Bacteroides faecis]|nr:RagB/SusD family nutrient uptake outer membrane protein [Bacteroides faecis]MCS3070111.1 RagB/SusD family nutrient uptake outer membrane protein [Bacteroides faecis]